MDHGLRQPLRAWLVDLYCTSAALAWDATVEIESEFTYSVPALPYAFQALAINGLIHGIKLEKQTMPLYLEEALELALGGYANGFPQNLWGNIIQDTAGPVLPTYYDALQKYSAIHGVPPIEALGLDKGGTIILSSNITISLLMMTSVDVGKLYVRAVDNTWVNNLISNEPMIIATH